MIHENCASFLQNIAEEKDGFKFGSLIKSNEQALGFIIPILQTKTLKRSYRLLEESKRVTIEDTGDINNVRFINKENSTIFIRSGTILMGKTQERATVGGVILQPGEEQIIEVNCVHASKPISKGAAFHVSEYYAPRTVATKLFAKNQSEVWNSIDAFTRETVPRIRSLRSIGSSHRLDDLLQTMEEVDKSKERIDGLIRDIPPVDNQVGVVVFGLTGVVGFEVFDSTESWNALHKKVIEKYADVLSMGPEEILYELKEGAINQKMTEFIDTILAAKLTRSHSTKNGNTYILTGEKLVGEYSEINGEIIHVLAMKQDTPINHGSAWGNRRFMLL